MSHGAVEMANECRRFATQMLTGNGDILQMFTSRAIGFVSGPYQDTSEVPKGLGARHEADGVLKILPEFELGLTDIEGF